jgi:hypothetical protein
MNFLEKSAFPYTPYYCEENAYHIVESLVANPDVTSLWSIYAIFISNRTKSVLLWQQKLASSSEFPVCWDYHAVVLLVPISTNCQALIMDFDTRLPFVSKVSGEFVSLSALNYDLDAYPDYLAETFPIRFPVDHQYARCVFCLIVGSRLIDLSASYA